MSLYDRLVPAEALRFDRIYPMTAAERRWFRLTADLYLTTDEARAMRPELLHHAIAPSEGTFSASWTLVDWTPPEPARPWLPWRKRR